MNANHDQQNEVKAVGLIGLGLVGTAIAEVLLVRGFDVVGFDVDEQRRAGLEALGGRVVASPKDVAEASARAILSLPDTDVVLEVVEGCDGIVQAAKSPRYIMDTTTGDPEETVQLAQRLERGGVHLLDATISGSSRQVRDREAVFMVGGDTVAFEQCADIFDALSEKVFYLGPSGSGSKAKLASNLILGLNRLALAEGLVFADVLGLDLACFLELLKTTPAYSTAVDTKGQKMLSEDFVPQSRIRQHRKDVSLILKYARRAGQDLPLAQVHLDILDRTIAAGDGDLDNAAVIREIARRQTSRQRGREHDSPSE